MPRLGDQMGPVGRRRPRADHPERVRLLDEPAQLVGRAGRQRVLEHRQPQVEPGAARRERFPGPAAQVVFEDRPQVREPDAAAAQGLAEPLLGQVGLTPEHLAAAADGLVERQVLEGVKGVVVNENADRPLGREQMSGVGDGPTQSRCGRVGGGRIHQAAIYRGPTAWIKVWPPDGRGQAEWSLTGQGGRFKTTRKAIYLTICS